MARTQATSHAGYSNYVAENGDSYGSFEIFYLDGATVKEMNAEIIKYDAEASPWRAGWYYQSCFPGCLPDSDPFGPYNTSKQAYDAAIDEE